MPLVACPPVPNPTRRRSPPENTPKGGRASCPLQDIMFSAPNQPSSAYKHVKYVLSLIQEKPQPLQNIVIIMRIFRNNDNQTPPRFAIKHPNLSPKTATSTRVDVNRFPLVPPNEASTTAPLPHPKSAINRPVYIEGLDRSAWHWQTPRRPGTRAGHCQRRANPVPMAATPGRGTEGRPEPPGARPGLRFGLCIFILTLARRTVRLMLVSQGACAFSSRVMHLAAPEKRSKTKTKVEENTVRKRRRHSA